MKKDYNRMTTSDMPMEQSFTPPVEEVKQKKETKPKINAIGKNTTAKVKQNVKAKSSTQEKKLRTKLINSDVEISDLEKLNEENIKSYRFKSKRNKVVIVLLSVLLAIAIASIATYLAITRLETNCNMILHGSVDAQFIVDGQEMSSFRAPSNLQGNRVLALDIQIRIEEAGNFSIRFAPKCYQKGVLMQNTLIYDFNTDLFYEGGDGYYYSKMQIVGNQTIQLCKGIILDYEYEDSLNVDNFRFEFHTYIDKI